MKVSKRNWMQKKEKDICKLARVRIKQRIDLGSIRCIKSEDEIKEMWKNYFHNCKMKTKLECRTWSCIFM